SIVASDVVIGDHGSVTFYAAMLGRPVLLGSFGTSELVPGTTTDLLGKVAPRVDGDGPLGEQIDEVLPLAPHVRDPIRDAAFAFQGQALPRHRDLLYRLIDLPVPNRPVAPRLPAVPEARWDEPSAWLVETEICSIDPIRIRVDRFAPGLTARRQPSPRQNHLAVVDGIDAAHLLESAGVIITSPSRLRTNPISGLRSVAARWPGCRVVAAPDGPDRWQVFTRDGHRTVASWDSSTGLDQVPASVVPSVVYAWSLTERWGPTDAPVTIEIEVADRVTALSITVARAD
ncbi:MAG TPA: hypothetical protein VNQ33_01320, partial [Acidimicrobiales bacterium]|nr:hypothetical protein [Acidimicrobiales bacterium]